MKTIEEANYESYKKTFESVQSTAICIRNKDYYFAGFENGIKFAQRLIPVEEDLPDEGMLVLSYFGLDDKFPELCVFKNGKFKRKERVLVPSTNEFATYTREDLTSTTVYWRPIELK